MLKIKLLIVEDEVETAEAYRMLLEEKFEVRFVNCVEEAEREITKWEPVVVLTDLALPGKSGVDLLQFLSDYPEIARVVITGYLDGFEKDLREKVTVDKILLKPLGDEKILTSAIGEAIMAACGRMAR
jgi:DNA-binding NtrC family response regulator